MKIIGLVGKAGAGKNKACDALENIYTEQELKCEQLAFAHPLKHICSDLFGLAYGMPHSAFYGSYEDKERKFQTIGKSGREVLQSVGDFFRNIDADVWCNYLKGHIDVLAMQSVDVVLVSDVRYLNEAQTIKDLGGTLIRVTRELVDAVEGTAGIPGHVSETQQLGIITDYVVSNEGTPEELESKLRGIVR